MMQNVLLSLMLLQVHCAAAEVRTITVITGSTPGWADTPDSGFAIELLTTFAATSPYRISLEVFPLKRALANFVKGPADCFIGGDSDSAKFAFPASTLTSRPIRKAGMVIYSSRLRAPVSSLEQATPLRIGLERGFDYQSILTLLPKISFEPAAAQQQIKKIAIGRIDGYVGLYPPSRPNADLVHSNPNFMLLSYTDTLQCRPSAENAVLLEDFNRFLQGYRRSGQLEKTLRRYFALPNADY